MLCYGEKTTRRDDEKIMLYYVNMPTYDLAVAKANAAKIGVKVKPSKNKNKKLDVFDKDGKKLASIGSKYYYDYTITRDKKKQKSYLARFAKTRVKVGSPSYFAWKILWS